MKYVVFSDSIIDPALCSYATYEEALADLNEREKDDYWDETDIYICEIINVRKAK
ncbi:hypothetical protein [Bacillus sp. FSL P4-0290]|uniref:hypothetical protein n=1 Tax=Bacillus sp. FSL P4-0290 TaxID=2921574 RepID=UPI0030CAE042